MPAAQEGLSFLFEIQDKITAKLAKIEAKAKASAKNIDSAFTKASKAQEANAAKVIHTEKMRGIAVESATAKATAARTKETAQGKILAQRLASAQSNEARKAANFRIAAAKRSATASDKAERKIAAAAKSRARVAIKAEKDHERALKVRAREQQKTSEASQAIAQKSIFVLAALAAALAATSVKLIALGSDAEETENVTGLAFGSMKGAAEKWAASFATSTGSSRFEATELVSDLGLIVKGMGFTEKASLGMSSRMVELAADMASAKNVPLDVALDKIRAGLIGESEPLRTMGVLLSEARVKEEAYASGLAKTGTELTNTQKVQARMNIILADSVAMHGDLINTQSSVANQWRAIKNRVFDAATVLGQKLLPAASEVLGVLGELVQKGADLVTWITESEERMKSLGAILAGVVVTGLGLAAAALWALVPAVTAATGGINLIIPLIAAGVGALIAGWIKFGDTIKDFLRNVWGKFLEKIAVDLKILSKIVGVFSNDWSDSLTETAEGLEATAVEMGKTKKATAKLAKEQKSATKVTEKATEATKVSAKAAAKAAKAAKKHAEMIADLGQTLQGLPTKAAIKEFEDLREAWASLGTAEQAEAMDAYSDALIEAEEAGHDLDKRERAMNVTRKWTLVLERRLKEAFINGQAAAKKRAEDNKEVIKANKEAIEAEIESLEALRLALLGLPTAAVVEDFGRLKTVWGELDEAERIGATDKYAEALRKAAENGIELSDAEVAIAESGSKMGDAWASGFFGTMQQAFEGGGGFMGGIKSMASQAFGQIFSKIGGDSGGGFTDALGKIFSGGGLMGKIGGMAGKLGGSIGKFMSIGLNGVPIVGPLLAVFGPLLMKGLKKIGGKIWGAITGGPSAAEKSGRKVAHEFRQGIIEGLTPEQFTEVGESWKQGWDSSVIVAIRDAAMAGGATFEAATALGLTMFNALWAAEKEGPEAVRRVIGQINAIIAGGDAAGEAAALAAEDRARRIQAFQETIDDIERQRIAKRLEFLLAAIEEEREAALEVMRDRHGKELAAIAEARSAKMEELRQGMTDALALIEEERDAALVVLRDRHSAELAALAEQRSAQMELLRQGMADVLAFIEEERDAQLEVLKGHHRSELETLDQHAADRLSALKGRHAAELTEIEKARDDALSPIERAIKDELDDAEIAVQLKIDLKKAGWDAEKIDAAKARAAEATARLEERREFKKAMDEAEAEIRASHQDEIDAINDHWDDKEKVATDRHKIEVGEEKAHSKSLRDTMEARHEAEIKALNDHFDDIRDRTVQGFRHLTSEWDLHYDTLEQKLRERHRIEIEALIAHYDNKRDKATKYWEDLIAKWEQYYDDLVDETRDRHEVELEELNAHYDALIDAAKGIIRRSLAEWEQYYDDLAAAARRGIADVEAEAPAPTVDPPAIPPKSIAAPTANPYDHSDPYGYYGDPYGIGRQHGGPVSAGQRYKVGEAGPEMFIPSERGRIEPHGSSGGGASAKDLARAVAESLEGMAVNVDGRKLGRLTVRHQPLAVAELGGRR